MGKWAPPSAHAYLRIYLGQSSSKSSFQFRCFINHTIKEDICIFVLGVLSEPWCCCFFSGWGAVIFPWLVVFWMDLQFDIIIKGMNRSIYAQRTSKIEYECNKFLAQIFCKTPANGIKPPTQVTDPSNSTMVSWLLHRTSKVPFENYTWLTPMPQL